jgi:hypothetical protein
MVFQAASLISFIWLLLERFAFYHFWSFYNQPIKIITNPLLLITIMLTSVGIVIHLLGFVAELLVRKTTDCHQEYTIKKQWTTDDFLFNEKKSN